jgi:dolichyl-phosphate beta-glucosyltransferase
LVVRGGDYYGIDIRPVDHQAPVVHCFDVRPTPGKCARALQRGIAAKHEPAALQSVRALVPDGSAADDRHAHADRIACLQPDISLILPAYNEAGAIGGTLSEAIRYFNDRGYSHEIIVSADGQDGTRELVWEMAKNNSALQAIGQNARRGKGRGIREAVAMAEGAIVGYADADNKVPIEEFDKIRPWFDDGYDLVIGSRALKESYIERRQPLYRRIGAAGFSLFMHTVVGLPEITDTQCGFKFFRKSIAKELFKQQRIDGYMFDVEILALASRLGYRVRQVPIRWRDDGDSRLELLRGNVRNVIDIFRIRFSQ